MTTLKDVARHAKVSLTTASYALNGTGTISAKTRKRVLQAAEELNYHPNAFAKHLKNRKTRTIGVFITRFGGSYYEEILEGIHDAVLKTDYELIVCPESLPVRRILEHRQVDGAIIYDSKINSSLLVKLASKKFPVVVMDRYLEAEYLLPLLIENQQGARDIFDHLYGQGLRKFVFISGAEDSFDNAERKQAFFAEAENHNLRIQTFSGNYTRESGYRNAKAIIASRDLPEAVFCANDQMAIGFIEAMQEHDLKAPDDIAVAGFDDIPIARYIRPSLTTIRVSRFQWGASAAAQLIDFLEDEKPFEPHRIPTSLMVRESSLLKRTLPTT